MQIQRHLITLLALPLLLLAPACGGGGDPASLVDDGYAALGSSDYDGAIAKFQKALEGMPTTDAGYKRAKMGEVEALIYVDAEKSKTEFLAMAKGMSSQISPKDYSAIASKMTSEKKFVPAIEVLDAGLKAHAEDVKLMAVLERVKVEAQKTSDPAAMEKLKGLGYL